MISLSFILYKIWIRTLWAEAIAGRSTRRMLQNAVGVCNKGEETARENDVSHVASLMAV
jgi:hypothetical protein